MLCEWKFYCLAVEYLGFSDKYIYINIKLGISMCTFIFGLRKKKSKPHICEQTFSVQIIQVLNFST